MRAALLVCRLVVACAFVTYGFVKILGGQFTHDDFIIDSRSTDPTSLVWSFYGYSPVYARFIGLCELIPGLLLLLPKTKTLGAVALLPVTVNITVMDFCFGFPAVKYVSLFLTVLCAILVASDYRKLKLIFWDSFSPEILDRRQGWRGESLSRQDQTAVASAVQAAPVPAEKKLVHFRPKWALTITVGLLLVLLVAHFTAIALTPSPVEAAIAKCREEGWEESDLTVRRWWREKGDFGVGMEAWVELGAANTGRHEVIRVLTRRAHGFVGWRGVQIEREK